MPEGYRIAAERSRRAVHEAGTRAWAELTWLGLPSVAAALGSILMGPTPGGLALAALALTGGAAACQKLALAHGDRRRARSARDFLGDEVRITPGIWASLDGRRRLRRGVDGRCLWEHLNPVTGITMASFVADAPLAPEPAKSVVWSRSIAQVFGPPRRACLFVGLPRPFAEGRPSRPGPTSVVAIEEDARGARLVRFDPHGRETGDTLHPDRRAALLQIEREHGSAIGPWHEEGASIESGSSWELGAQGPI